MKHIEYRKVSGIKLEPFSILFKRLKMVIV